MGTGAQQNPNKKTPTNPPQTCTKPSLRTSFVTSTTKLKCPGDKGCSHTCVSINASNSLFASHLQKTWSFMHELPCTPRKEATETILFECLRNYRANLLNTGWKITRTDHGKRVVGTKLCSGSWFWALSL